MAGHTGWVPLSRPVPSRGRPSFPFNKSLQFFTLLHKRGPPARSCVVEGSGSLLLSRGRARTGALFSRTEGRVDPTFPVKLALNSSPCIMATRHVPHGNDYDFSRDNSIITSDSLRSVENFWYSSGRRLGRSFMPCVNNC